MNRQQTRVVLMIGGPRRCSSKRRPPPRPRMPGRALARHPAPASSAARVTARASAVGRGIGLCRTEVCVRQLKACSPGAKDMFMKRSRRGTGATARRGESAAVWRGNRGRTLRVTLHGLQRTGRLSNPWSLKNCCSPARTRARAKYLLCVRGRSCPRGLPNLRNRNRHT